MGVTSAILYILPPEPYNPRRCWSILNSTAGKALCHNATKAAWLMNAGPPDVSLIPLLTSQLNLRHVLRKFLPLLVLRVLSLFLASWLS